jgi:hypothetical protein
MKYDFPNVDWLRGLGFIIVGLGIYYAYAAVAGYTGYFVASVFVRYGAFGGSILLALFTSLPKQVIYIGLVDAVMASWTLLVL